MSERTDKPSSFRDPKPLLSGRDMLQHHVGNYDFHTRIRLVQPEEECEQQENISRIQNEFRTILAQQRVGKGETYSEGEWDNDRKRVRIRKAVGKWHIYGYVENKIQYLEGYEALHLLEMNRLIVFWDTIMVSLEQAYSLFLGYQESLSLEHYKVYSTMMRAGFYLLKCDSKRKYQMATESRECELDEEQACVWMNLYNIMRQSNPLVDQNTGTNRILMQQVQRSMRNFNSIIALQSGQRDEGTTLSGCNSEKRENLDQDQVPPPKRQRTDETVETPETENKSKFDRFVELFDSFDIVQSTIDTNPGANDQLPNVTLHFDVFFNSDGSTFRKSQPFVPEYRMIIQLSSEPLLTASDIASLYHRQPKPDVPILLMQVAETLSMHCFLYSFYRLPNNLVLVPPVGRPPRSDRDDEDDVLENSDSSDSANDND